MANQTLVFLGSKPIGYRCFEHLLDKQESLGFHIVGLLSNDNNRFDSTLNLSELAKAHHIPLLASLDELPEVDILYSVQYHQILKQEHIAKARKLAVNLHMAPLPEYRGCNQFSFAIVDGRNEFGTSIHRIDPLIDHGDLLFEKRFAIPDPCWIQELYELTYQASIDLFKESLPALLSGQFEATSQADLERARGSSLHYRHEINELKQIDLSWDREKIERHIRATSMPGFEPPFFILGEKKIYFCSEWIGEK